MKLTWRKAWANSPGPRTGKEALKLFLKGFCMGVADIIPGVSGGTIAFITGIYEKLLAAISSFDMKLITHVKRLKLREALGYSHIRFLTVLLAGIGFAIISTSHLMHWLLEHHPAPTWALFCGLIGASVIVIGRHIGNWKKAWATLILGTIAAYHLVNIIPIETPNDWWFLFISGMIAICAMILPGVSGSFLLLMLGKYEYVIGAVKNPFISEHVLILLIFAAGAICGLLLFSRLLKWCLANYHDLTMSMLMGLMIGGLRKIWPWKEVVEKRMIAGKWRDLQTTNVMPDSFNTEVAVSITLALIGFFAVILLFKISSSKTSEPKPLEEKS